MTGYVITVSILSGTTLAGFIAYLRFCEKVMRLRGNPEDLKHAAAAARGFRATGFVQVAEALTKRSPTTSVRGRQATDSRPQGGHAPDPGVQDSQRQLRSVDSPDAN